MRDDRIFVEVNSLFPHSVSTCTSNNTVHFNLWETYRLDSHLIRSYLRMIVKHKSSSHSSKDNLFVRSFIERIVSVSLKSLLVNLSLPLFEFTLMKILITSITIASLNGIGTVEENLKIDIHAIYTCIYVHV